MKPSLQLIAAILALFATTLGTGLQEFVHHDVVNVRVLQEETLAAHTCGGLEYCLNLEAAGVCTICTYSRQLTVEELPPQIAPLNVIVIVPFTRSVDRPNIVDLPQCSKRGPPPTFA